MCAAQKTLKSFGHIIFLNHMLKFAEYFTKEIKFLP